MSSQKGEEEEGFPWGLLVIAFVVTGVWALWWWKTWTVFGDWKEAGPFGDTFGGVNALFSGLAFGGIIYTIVLQRRELRLQRLELRDTRREMERQREEMSSQNQTLRLQQFDSTFFQLLRLHHDIVNGMTKQRTGQEIPLRGREVFQEIYGKAGEEVPAHLLTEPPKQAVESAWDDVYKVYQPYLGTTSGIFIT